MDIFNDVHLYHGSEQMFEKQWSFVVDMVLYFFHFILPLLVPSFFPFNMVLLMAQRREVFKVWLDDEHSPICTVEDQTENRSLDTILLHTMYGTR